MESMFSKPIAGFAHQYVLIGGAACDIIMDEVGLTFRATKDLDVVILAEALDAAFGTQFWAFVEAGGYQQRERSNGDKIFYRFQRPTNPEYPSMLELFSRAPDTITPAKGSELTPLPIDEDIANLSAILLDEHYYTALIKKRRIIDDVAVLDERLLIPFKAKAHLDLAGRRVRGEQIDSRHIRKHRAEVFRLINCSQTMRGSRFPHRSWRISRPLPTGLLLTPTSIPKISACKAEPQNRSSGCGQFMHCRLHEYRPFR